MGEPLTGLENKADVDGEKWVVSLNTEGRKLEAGSSEEVISLLRQEFALPLEENTGPSTITYGGDEGIREYEWREAGRQFPLASTRTDACSLIVQMEATLSRAG